MDEIQALFGRIAPVYDAFNDALSLGLHHVWKRMAVQWVAPPSGSIVLDLCCGTGDLAYLLAQVVGMQGQVYGVDFARPMLAQAQRRYPAPQITWVEGDVLTLPFADRSCQGVTMGYGFRNVRDRRRCLQEIQRVLQPGYRAALLDFHRPADPLMQAFQRAYLEALVVPLAQGFGLGPDYAYIWESLQRFPTGPEQVALAKTLGFHAVHYPLMGSLMGVLVLTRPAD